MTKYIDADKLKAHYAWWGDNSSERTLFDAIIDVQPAADVVEVDVKDLRVKKAIQTLCEFYSTAKKSDYVQKPLAWALYQTWKSFDKMDGGVNDGT